MNATSRRHLTYANVMVTILAVVVACGGATAWAKLRVSSGNIVDRTIRARDLHAAAVTRPKLATGAVGSTQLATAAVTSDKVATVPFVQVTQSTTQNFGSTLTDFSFDSEEYDPFAMHSAAVPAAITVNRAGLWSLHANVAWSNDAVAGSRMVIMSAGGAGVAFASGKAAAIGFFAGAQSLGADVRLAAGDIVHLQAMSVTDVNQPATATMTARWVGP